MRKVVRRLVAAFFVILMLVTLFPFQVFAVDPVSAATMANALAQALTAYGASHGVSMMFDVTTTSGIGEGLHDLWGQFKADINDNDVPTYDSLAVTMWTNLYTKVRDSVAINVSAENVGYFDQFWNWLLSGPAEMTRVDNQYYEWTMTDGVVSPISVYSNLTTTINGVSAVLPPANFNGALNVTIDCASGSFVIVVCQVTTEGYSRRFYSCSDVPFTDTVTMANGTQVGGGAGQVSTSGWYWQLFSMQDRNNNIPVDVTLSSVPQSIEDVIGVKTSSSAIASSGDMINVRPYVGDTVPQNVPIPDTSDPDYSPTPYVGPLGVPWIDNNFGDGQSLTDAQREAIAGALDGEIEDDGTLTLEEEQTVPDNPGGEVIGGPSAYTVPGLADVFPFCIPFDIYHFLQALSAEPTAPHFTATLAFPEAVGGSQEIDIDFDTPTFNQIAAILRTMELLAFCVGLALLTRSMFLRG